MNIRTGGTIIFVLMIVSSLNACNPIESVFTDPTPTVQPSATPQQPEATPTAAAGPIELEVTANGTVQARQDAELSFQAGGVVGDVLVEEGDQVQEGELLAILDTRSFEQSIRNAEAALQQAQAQQAALTEDPLDEQVQQAQAAVEQARGQLNQTQGSITNADIAAAEQQLAEARASLADLLAGPDDVDIRAAEAQRDAAQAALETQRTQLSQAKTQAEIEVARASDNLWAAQSNYSNAYWNWRESEELDGELIPDEIPLDLDLSDNISQFFSDQLTQAIVQLRQAEFQLEAAQLQLEQAQESEISGLQQAQAQLEQAQSNLDKLLQPPDPNQEARARAAVASAEANLARLTGEQRAGQLQAARAGVTQAQANLEQLFADPTESQQAQAAAAIAQAQANLEQAQLNREYAEIRAPFAGEVAVVGIDEGDAISAGGLAGQPAVRLVDLSRLYVTIYVNEALIDQVQEGQSVEIIADAIPGQVFTGNVTFVSPTATVQQGVTTYEVQVELDEEPQPLKIGMSVVVNIAGTVSRDTADISDE